MCDLQNEAFLRQAVEQVLEEVKARSVGCCRPARLSAVLSVGAATYQRQSVLHQMHCLVTEQSSVASWCCRQID